jgi:transcriptional regulator with XRE-family HTH domain
MNTGHTAIDPEEQKKSLLAGPIVVRMMLGGRLRQLREATGLTCADAGYAIRRSHSKISRLELGRTGFKRRDVADLLSLYGVYDRRERDNLLTLVDKANAPGWRDEYDDVLSSLAGTRLELEQGASVIRCYETHFVPQLLQTEDYARALMGLQYLEARPTEIDRRIGLLMKRQQTLHRPEPCKLWAVVDEAALRRRFGSAATLREQLEKLIEISELPHVTIQVVPFTTGVAAGGPITFLRFPEPEVMDVVYLDQFAGALYLDRPPDVQHYGQVMDHLCTQADPPTATQSFLRRLIKEI